MARFLAHWIIENRRSLSLGPTAPGLYLFLEVAAGPNS